ncbi:MAG TPA: hypothetical protein VE200_08680 [Xanthobacteraceae bacterium]|nr:hypothetical protein [Xanthobacteraceae bacterium]
MNLQQLLLECYRRLNFTTTPQASVTVRLTAQLNEAHRRLLTSPGIEQLRDDSVTITVKAGEDRVGLPPNVAKIRQLTDVSNGRYPLRAIRLRDIRREDSGLQTGTPEAYAPLTEQCVQVQPKMHPTEASPLWVESDAAADTTPVVHVESITEGGYRTVASRALSGTTRVQLGTRTDHVVVTQFSLSAPAVGYVTLHGHSNASNREMATIEPGRTTTNYHLIALWPTPAADTAYALDYTRHISDLVAPTDEPSIPYDFHYLLVTMACRREFTFQDDKVRYAMMVAEEQEGMQALRAFVLYPPDYRVRNNDPEVDDYWGSNLGPDFPAGRW